MVMIVTPSNIEKCISEPLPQKCNERLINIFKKTVGKKEIGTLVVGVFSISTFGLAAGFGISLAIYGIFRCTFSNSPKYARRYPPLSSNDTFMGNLKASLHGKANVFEDEEIIKVHDIFYSRVVENVIKNIFNSDEKEDTILKLKVELSNNHRAIVPQQSTRGCSAAAMAMLIIDNNKIPDLQTLTTWNVRNSEFIIQCLEKIGLKCLKTSVKNLRQLEECLQTNGSAIVPLEDENAMGHCVIVDEIHSNGITLRDSYHGWEIDVDNTAFIKRTFATTRNSSEEKPIEIIQVMKDSNFKH